MTARHFLATTISWIVAILLLPLPLILVLNHGLIDAPSNVLAIDLGLFAYVWWLAIIFLSTRPRWLVQLLGMPGLYFLHASLGILAIIAAFLHKSSLFSMHQAIKQTGNIAFYLEVFLLVYAIFFLSGWLIDRSAWLKQLKDQGRGIFSHQLTMWIHRLNFLVVALIFVHVNLIPRLSSLPGFMAVFDLYTLLALGSYAYKKLVRDNGHQAAVKAARHLNNRVIELTLTQPDNLPTPQAGDFYFVRFLHNRKLGREAHPFSLANDPQADGTLVLQIEQVGDFTEKLDAVKLGERVELEGPFGNFAHEVENAPGSVVLYGLGSGIAPLLSIAKAFAGRKKIHIIWSQGHAQGKYYDQVMTKLQKLGVKVDYQPHRFRKPLLDRILTEEEKQSGRVLVVGSGLHVLQVEKTLSQLGFKDGQVFDERLTL